jgi:hypothetical protein
VRSVEFLVGDGVARVLELRDDPAAGDVDRQDVVCLAVGDEDARPALGAAGNGEARGERDHVREQAAVVEPERQRVRGAVGEAADCELLLVHRAPIERLLERAIHELHVGAERTADGIPRRPARIGDEQDDPEAVGEGEAGRQPIRAAAGAVQHQREGRRLVRRVRARHDEDAVPALPETQRMLSRADGRRRLAGTDPQQAVATACGLDRAGSDHTRRDHAAAGGEETATRQHQPPEAICRFCTFFSPSAIVTRVDAASTCWRKAWSNHAPGSTSTIATIL